MKLPGFVIVVIIEVAILVASSYMLFIAGMNFPRWQTALYMSINLTIVMLFALKSARLLNANQTGKAILSAIISLPVGILVTLMLSVIVASVFP